MKVWEALVVGAIAWALFALLIGLIGLGLWWLVR